MSELLTDCCYFVGAIWLGVVCLGLLTIGAIGAVSLIVDDDTPDALRPSAGDDLWI